MGAEHGRSDAPFAIDFRQMLDALADPVVAADASNRIVYLNGAAERLLGWERDELLGRPLSTIQPARFRDIHLTAFNRFMETRIPRIMGQPIRVPALHRDGSEIDIELTLSALDRPDGTVLVVGSLRDLRTRVELERQLTVTRYLRASTVVASHLATLLDLDNVLQTVVTTLEEDFDAALARIWLYDPDERALLLRASAGVSTETVRSSRARIDVETYPYKIADVFRTRQPFISNDMVGNPRFEQDWVTREGIASVAVFPLQIAREVQGVLAYFSRQPLPGELVEVLTSFAAIVTASVNDVTLLAQAQAARAEAEEAVRVRDDFLSIVSHDLKNPLAAIKGRAQMLRRRVNRLPEGEAERFRDGLDNIDALTTRMTRLIDDLVDLARLRIGQPLALHCDSLDLVELVQQVAAEQQESTTNHEIRVQPRLPAVIGDWDRFRLERVFTNLLNNAIKYTPRGGEILVTIDREEGNEDPMAVVQVRDRGIGIPTSDLPHVFNRYHRAANVVGEFEGTGVGLAGAKQIVEQHSGTVMVESQEGEGTVFTVRLPASG